jgi:hypothetical protein
MEETIPNNKNILIKLILEDKKEEKYDWEEV